VPVYRLSLRASVVIRPAVRSCANGSRAGRHLRNASGPRAAKLERCGAERRPL